MTQLTQGSDMELREAIKQFAQVAEAHFCHNSEDCDGYHGDIDKWLWGEYGEGTDLLKAIEDYKQRSIDRAEIEARIDEAASVTVLPDGTVWSLQGEGQSLDHRIAELEQQLSPTTLESK